ncbi:hypothetical protein [Streptomyces scabiei]|uniref:hypothetical protein n=3 Tax=Streptomyces scabiei TaxID=1930 RepID=UPI001B31BB6D|nr:MULTISPECIES: hypothetical protein [Streptomyces]MBP5892848.1 hypothetical protein [Streptomyces sp. LBUM 1481]MBP5923114.1 hypothetical protein [Streptomyces sp. LBUM 1483]MDX2756540.1 hypothetical protein [Streptomyces scabiei]MDX3219056.1 hypothetical protein [Streptomyces scabiei]MDX3295422.1 hypothetical protein [Streptomyces scabiei]
MAAPGYGKRAAPGQLPRTAHDFADLLPREAAIAAYLDRLPDGADISVKTLAKELPYGQCALRTALNRLQAAGHLRRGREHLTAVSGTAHWITRTWFSRTARDDDWWARFTRGDVPEESYKPPPTRSRAHILLAALGRETPALSLSQSDCAELAPLLLPWFERGATDEVIRRALVSGLPAPVHSPAALLRTRLLAKLPPKPAPAPDPVPPPPRMLECGECGTPGPPEALPGGMCGACRGERAPARPYTALSAAAVRTHASRIRAAMSPQPRERTPV